MTAELQSPSFDHGAADLGHTDAWATVTAFLDARLAPGFGRITNASEVTAAERVDALVFTAVVQESLDTAATTRLHRASIVDGRVDRLGERSGDDRCPRLSPDGTVVAFLSDSV